MSDSTRIAKKRRITGSTIILSAGKGLNDTFHVHESVLTEKCLFFRAILAKQWKEGIERSIELPDDTTEVVAAYVEWLYSGKVATMTDTPHSHKVEYNLLAHLYMFGEKIQDNGFCNAIMQAMNELVKNGRVPTASFVKIVYQGTPATSPARAFVVHIFRDIANRGWMDSIGSKEIFSVLPEFLLDLSLALMPVSRKKAELAEGRNMKIDEWLKREA